MTARLLSPPREGAFAQLRLFLAAYLLYNIGRWVAVGDLDQATEHPEWIVSLESDLGIQVERSVQDALDSGAVMWLMSNVYLAAQLAVLPGSLIWLYRRSPAVYRRLRDTVLATWLRAIPIYALFPVAPPRLADIGPDRRGQPAGRRPHGTLDRLLQLARRGPEPALRLRIRGRHRVVGGVAAAHREGALAALGPDGRAHGRRHRQPLCLRHRGGPAGRRRRLPGRPLRLEDLPQAGESPA